MKRPNPVANPVALSRAVGERHMQQALDKIQLAQNLLDEALQELSPILYASAQWDRGHRLRQRVRAWWDAVEQRRTVLRKQGGPRVDATNLRAELASAQAAAHG